MKRNAEVLVRNAAAHVPAQADLIGFEEAGVYEYQLSAVLDTRTSKLCATIDQKVFNVSDPSAGYLLFTPAAGQS